MQKFFSILVMSCSAMACSLLPAPVLAQTELELMQKVPALAWLAVNKNPSAIAANRFGHTRNARAFVAELLRLGAVEVYVAEPRSDPRQVEAEGGPYADSLIVELPFEAAKRFALFQVLASEARREHFDPEPDTGQRLAFLWWD
jgi:hypothetical protein